MSRSRPLALLAAAALTAALAPAALATAAAPTDADRSAERARAEHERVVAYWTPERMRAAIPRDFVRQADGSFRLAPTPKAKPGGSTANVVAASTGSSWSGGGDVVQRTGKVFFTMGGFNYVCSGSVAEDSASETSIVLTAAHCVFDNVEQAWATNWTFVPAFDLAPYRTCASTSLGCWTAQRLVAHAGFINESTYSTAATTHDFAFAVVGPGGNSTEKPQLDSRVGAYPMEFALTSAARMTALGYPAAGKYSGNDLTYCSGSLTRDPYNRYGNPDDPWGLPCTMTGGSSGGPWLVSQTTDDGFATTLDAQGAGGALGSLNSYGYSGIRYMFGPVFDTKAQAVWNVAQSGGALPTTSVQVQTLGQ